MKKSLFLCLAILCLLLNIQARAQSVKLSLDASDLRYQINRNIYGHFSEHLGHCIYGGLWVGENSKIPNTNGIRNDVVAALRRIKIPVLRWPGGCFADEYHWQNGIGPREKRPSMINTNWGGVTEDNSFGTHEFLELCRQLECEPCICGNVGSGTVQELSQWIEYINSDNISPLTDLRKQNGREKSWSVKYWGIGNESWGCGGNMRPEYYADQLRRYGTYCRDYGQNKIFKIASGSSDGDYNWTEVIMKNAANAMQGLSLHHYAFNDGTIATDFDEQGWFNVIKNSLVLEEYISGHSAVMDKYDPNKKIALIVDEWGTWYKVEPGTNPGFLYQQNTLRDAVTAACNLNIFNNHCDRVRMANIAQMINVLQAVILTDEERMVLTPTYYVFDLFKVHQDALLIPLKIETADYVLGDQKLPAVNASASLDLQGRVHITLCNINPRTWQKISCELSRFKTTGISGQILTAAEMNDHNTFEHPDVVVPKKYTDFKMNHDGIEINLPPKAVVVLELTGKYELPPALDVKNPKPGINFSYYEGQWDRIPGFESLSAKRTGVVNTIVLPAENSGENFGVQYKGYIKIPADGLYTFYLNSDDGSDLCLDKKVLVDNDGRHAAQEQSGTVILKAGFHEIKVGFFQGPGGKVLEASISGPGLTKQIIPAHMLFQMETRNE
jgi:alpha-N-arabinofuranosidase